MSYIHQGKFAEALAKFDALLSKYPKSPRATYGRALALDKKAESERSNKVLEQSIDQMLKVLDLPDVPKPLLIEAGKKCADRQTFRGTQPTTSSLLFLPFHLTLNLPSGSEFS